MREPRKGRRKKRTKPAGHTDTGLFYTRVSISIFGKDTYTRGAGSLPDCTDGQQKDAGLCYPACNPGYHGVGPVCWGECPEGYDDHGGVCYHPVQVITKL